jgi:hypothetical protein
MFPQEQDTDQALTDLFRGRESPRQFVAKQQRDLDRIGPGNREKGTVGQNEAVGDETVKVR